MLRAWRGRPQAYRAVAEHETAAVLAGLALPVLLLTSPDDFFHASFDRAQSLLPDAPVAVTGSNFQPTADPDGSRMRSCRSLAPRWQVDRQMIKCMQRRSRRDASC